MYPAFVIFE